MLDDVGAYCPGISTTAAPECPLMPSALAATNTACELALAAASADDLLAWNNALSSEP
jgi:hypothetical protein